MSEGLVERLASLCLSIEVAPVLSLMIPLFPGQARLVKNNF